jgi:putative DNA methylase
MSIKAPKKLIEVALPLDDINVASAREKSIRHGHPSTLHLWWARRPLAAARAVLFAQMVNDPGGERGYFAGKTKTQADAEREKLFQIIRELVKWENTNNEEILELARDEIRKSWRETCALNKGQPGFDPDRLPAFHDPFAGGGAIPLEAQRLGLESHASDLNPVAVLINKAMIEIPPRFAGRPPVGPVPPGEKQQRMHDDWSGARGLAEDVRRYGHWMREEAHRRIGYLYPKVAVTAELANNRPDLKPYINEKLTVIAWLWARTVKSPNPAFSHVHVPLVSSFVISNKPGKEVWVEPVVENDCYRFNVRADKPSAKATDGTKAGGRGANFQCLLSAAPIDGAYIKAESKGGRAGTRLMAVVAEGKRGRVYLSPTEEMETTAASVTSDWKPDIEFSEKALGFRIGAYGLSTWADLFTPRQLNALCTFSDLIACARDDAIAKANLTNADDGISFENGGRGATAYGDAIATYLAFALDKMADLGNSLCRWEPIAQCPRQLFGRQAIPMVWDFAEANPLSTSSGSWIVFVEGISKAFRNGFDTVRSEMIGLAYQADAASFKVTIPRVISTDPPYYDNIGYADLSDFFYVWLRRSLRTIFPSIFSTLTTPKAEELVATPFRHGGKEGAELFFLQGMTTAMRNIGDQGHSAFPIAIYYAFKQADTVNAGTSSTGWETFISSVIGAGLTISGTWPLNTENASRMRGQNSNALASSIVLVCRRREGGVETINRRDFQRLLRDQMPEALQTMIGGTIGQSPIAPVDLAQAAIGPGMAIFSKYAAVLNQDGTPMSVHEALILINREITDFLTPDSGSFDADTLFCNSWFEQYGWSAGPFGDADVLSRGKGTSVSGVSEAGIVESGGGKVRLLRWAEYEADWDPKTDKRNPVWESAHHLIHALNQQGESEAGALLAAMPDKAEPIRQLAYHLYTLCERKKWADDARAYNELITAWHAIVSASHETGHRNTQLDIDL